LPGFKRSFPGICGLEAETTRRKMMAMDEVRAKVADIIANQLGVDKETVTPEANVIDDLGADSLDIVELVMALEESFDLEIPDEDAEKIRTVQDILSYLESQLKS
jgi:acyl carrier protein